MEDVDSLQYIFCDGHRQAFIERIVDMLYDNFKSVEFDACCPRLLTDLA